MYRQILSKAALLALTLALLASAPAAQAQSQKGAPVPYASIRSNDINYFGPGRAASYDLAGATVRIGLIVPLAGPEKPNGDAILAAARLALEDDAAHGPLPGGRRLALAVGDESGPSWGHLSDVLIHLVLNDRVIAVVASANGSTAHLSEQVGNRLGVAILTLASDKTTTQIDLPWIFRPVPSDTVQAQTMARDIYRVRGFRRVLLVTEDDHDGRLGGKEFEDAARELNAPPPTRVSVDPLKPDLGATLAAIHANSSEALVLWTRPDAVREMLDAIRKAGISLPAYLCQEAAQESSGLDLASPISAAKEHPARAAIWTVARSGPDSALQESFARRFRQATGEVPSPVAAEAYDTVRLIARAVREAGPNRARVRDRIAGMKNLAGAAGTLSFDNEGNALGGARLVRLVDRVPRVRQ